MKRLLKGISAILALMVVGCAGIDFRQTMENVSEVAQAMCETSMVLEIEEVEEWCSVAENVAPFIQELIGLAQPVKKAEPVSAPIPLHPIPRNPYE